MNNIQRPTINTNILPINKSCPLTGDKAHQIGYFFAGGDASGGIGKALSDNASLNGFPVVFPAFTFSFGAKEGFNFGGANIARCNGVDGNAGAGEFFCESAF